MFYVEFSVHTSFLVDRKWWSPRSFPILFLFSIMEKIKWWYVPEYLLVPFPLPSLSPPYLQLPTLRTLGNIVTGNDAQTQAVLNAGILQYLPALLHHERPGIVRASLCSWSEMMGRMEYMISLNRRQSGLYQTFWRAANFRYK